MNMFEVARSQMPSQNSYYNIQIVKSASNSINTPNPTNNNNNNCKYSFKVIFKVYFNFTFFLGIAPFRFVQSSTNNNQWNKNNNHVKYKMTKFFPQMVLCALIHLLIIYNYLMAIRSIKFKQLLQNPVVYFELFQTIANSFFRIAFCFMLWIKQKDLMKVMDFSEDLPSPSDKVVKRVAPMAIILCILYTSFGLTCGILGDEYASHASLDREGETSNNWTPSSFLQSSSAKAKYLLFLSSSSLPYSTPIFNITANGTKSTNSTTKPLANLLSEMELEDICLGILGMTMSIYRNLCTFLSNLFLLLVTISLAIHSKGFYHLITPRKNNADSTHHKNNNGIINKMPVPLDLEMNVNYSVQFIMSKYKGLKELGKLLNSKFGSLMLLYILTMIATLSTYMDSVITEPDIFTRFRIAWSTNTFVIILTVGSNICAQISELKTWFSYGDNGQQLSIHHLIILINELNEHPIGISGMGLFTIHFKFVAGLVSTLVTYFIIMLQFQEGAESTLSGLSNNNNKTTFNNIQYEQFSMI